MLKVHLAEEKLFYRSIYQINDMEKNQARKLIQNTLQNSFNPDTFGHFLKELLNNIDTEKQFSYHGQYIPDAYKQYITKYSRIGTYTDTDDKKIDLLVVHLKKETSLERARTAQRNFILTLHGELISRCSKFRTIWKYGRDYRKIQYKD